VEENNLNFFNKLVIKFYQRCSNKIILIRTGILFLCFITLDLMLFIALDVSITPMKIAINLVYSFIFSYLTFFKKHIKFSRSIFIICLIALVMLYMGEFFFVNNFYYFATLKDFSKIEELTKLGESVKDYIKIEYLTVLLLPILIYIALHFIERRFDVVRDSKKNIRRFSMVAFFIVVLLTNTWITSLTDINKLYLEDSNDFVTNYGLLDMVTMNGINKLLKMEQSQPKDYIAETPLAFNNTERNDFSGKYEGKNLIFINGESIAPYAIDPVLTPTLYKLKTEGYYFDNFYSASVNTYYSEYSYIDSFYFTSEKSVDGLQHYGTMPTLFHEKGYTSQAFHNYYSNFYDRKINNILMGYDENFGSVELGIEATDMVNFPRDIELFENSFKYYQNEDKFFSYFMTVTSHGPYDYQKRELLKQHIPTVKQKYPNYSENSQSYLAAAMELDLGVSRLFEQLTENDLLDDTVILFVGDHFPYALNDSLQKDFKIEDSLQLYNVPFIIWDASQPSEIIHYPMGNVDILPTISNMFALDLQLTMGKDVFSLEQENVIIEWYNHRNYSFILGNGTGYDGKTNTKIGNITDDEITQIKQFSLEREKLNKTEKVEKENIYVSEYGELKIGYPI